MESQVQELEAMVVDAWPAAETADLDGWLLRASGGPTHRGNSIATLASRGSAQLEARIERAERWYHERAQPALFQIGPCVAPLELDAALAARGYVAEGASRFAAAATDAVLASSAMAGALAAKGSARVESSPSAAWLEVKASASRFAGQLEGLLGFIRRLGPRCRFVTVDAEPGVPAAVGLGVTSGHRLGVYAMLTVPAQRRRGAARAALRALAERARAEGLDELYLLFDASNAAARSLYLQCGFREKYGYHYRLQPFAGEH